jgi:Family of unknown function (DUF5985)
MPRWLSSDFVSGATTMGLVVLALMFVKYGRKTGDTFFLLFSIAFALLAVDQIALAMTRDTPAERWIYLLRLCAFGFIIVAIVRKNLGGERRGSL